MPLDDAALTQFLELSFDALCTRRVSDLVSVEAIMAGVDDVTAKERVARFHARFVVPSRERLLARGKTSAVKLGAWLPKPASDKIAAALAAPYHLPRSVIDDLATSDEVKQEVRAMLEQAILGFLKKGEKSPIGLGARAVAQMGKGLLGGIGEGIQKQVQERVRDFVDAQVGSMQERLAKKLASEETARSLGRVRKKWFLSALEKSEKELSPTVHQIPFALLDALVPEVVRHNATRAEVREAVTVEVKRALDELSTQTVGELLDELGLRQRVRAEVRDRGLPLARDLVATEAFRAFWERARAD